jgi:lysozyme
MEWNMTELDLQNWIKQCEVVKYHPYMDTIGNVKIGYGRNLDNGINLDEAQLMFKNDYDRTVKELENQDWYTIQPQGVKFALINMNFNIGIEKLLEFHEMITSLKKKDYNLAADASLNSLWANKVGRRAVDIAKLIRDGK